MKKRNSKTEAQARNKKLVEKASTAKSGNVQRKLKTQQESSESGKTDP
ncbi:hypothetical protein A2U01_0110492, partial [Trifolium medium]|nr:hypothetical protein [Trifolium medium]